MDEEGTEALPVDDEDTCALAEVVFHPSLRKTASSRKIKYSKIKKI